MKNLKLNSVIVVWICLVAIRHVVNIFKCISILLSKYGEHDKVAYNMIVSIIMIIILIGIIKLKKRAVFSFFLLQIINSFFVWDMNYRVDSYFLHLSIALLFSIIMAGLMFLKKDGKSGWELMFKK